MKVHDVPLSKPVIIPPSDCTIIREPSGWFLRIHCGQDEIMYRSPDFLRLRGHAERYFKRNLQWERTPGGGLWAKV